MTLAKLVVSIALLGVALAPLEAEAGGLLRRDKGTVVACYAKTGEPARYELAGRKVIARPAWTERRVEPARYEERLERVLVSPARDVWIARRPVYRTVIERVVVRAAYRKWHTVVDEGGNALRTEIVVPAEVVEVPRRVLVSDGGRVRRHLPAVYKSDRRLIEVRGERVRVVRHAAVLRTVHERLLVQPSHTRWRQICG